MFGGDRMDGVARLRLVFVPGRSLAVPRGGGQDDFWVICNRFQLDRAVLWSPVDRAAHARSFSEAGVRRSEQARWA